MSEPLNRGVSRGVPLLRPAAAPLHLVRIVQHLLRVDHTRSYEEYDPVVV
ncbi:hypothetical protein GCM10010272_67800 [Streptomyces lateritius]|nr:hypothetical protein GCM10010272_67800 [Streptomyces lateritius]